MDDTITPPTCDARLWARGEDVRCGQTVGVRVWQDFTNATHHGCSKHIDALQHRYPEYLPESKPNHGKLALSTPWARGAFGPADRIDIENEIPEDWTVAVSVAANRAWVILWALDPTGNEAARWTHIRFAQAITGTLEFARYVAALAGDPVAVAS